MNAEQFRDFRQGVALGAMIGGAVGAERAYLAAILLPVSGAALAVAEAVIAGTPRAVGVASAAGAVAAVGAIVEADIILSEAGAKAVGVGFVIGAAGAIGVEEGVGVGVVVQLLGLNVGLLLSSACTAIIEA